MLVARRAKEASTTPARLSRRVLSCPIALVSSKAYLTTIRGRDYSCLRSMQPWLRICAWHSFWTLLLSSHIVLFTLFYSSALLRKRPSVLVFFTVGSNNKYKLTNMPAA